jgi:DNA adenine methylase
MLSNSDTPLVRELYSDPHFQVIEIEARRNINSRAGGRGPITELLITNFWPVIGGRWPVTGDQLS